jgi:hypothetical protein
MLDKYLMPKLMRPLTRATWLGLVLNVVGLALAAEPQPTTHTPVRRTFSVLDYGASGDGTTLDTAAINQAISACARAGGGQVLFPPGRYLSGTVHLTNGLTLFLAAGATLVGTTNLALYEQPAVPSFMPEARFGKWHRALIVGSGLKDVAITGGGVIDGDRVFDPTGEERMRGPHAIAFTDCRHFTIRDVSIVDAANYAIYFQVSDDVDVRNVKIIGGWDGVHFRGVPAQWCRNVNIVGCQFYTGDDSIAGRYWDNVVISQCVVNSSCNGIRLIGPATHLIVDHCLFYGPGQQPHRSSNRTNMLSGINLQPGAWDQCPGLLDDVLLSNNTMKNVASPLTLWAKPGNPVGRVTVSGLEATGIYHSAVALESWSDAPITNVVLRGVTVEFNGGGTAEDAKRQVRGPGVDVRPLPAWGLYARNVEQLTLEDVRFALAKDDLRPVATVGSVQRLTLDNFRFTHSPGVTEPLVTTNVGKINLWQTDLISPR